MAPSENTFQFVPQCALEVKDEQSDGDTDVGRIYTEPIKKVKAFIMFVRFPEPCLLTKFPFPNASGNITLVH